MRNDIHLDFTSLPKELRLLLLLMNKKSDDILHENGQEIFVDIQWERFLELARHHRVYPVIYRRFKELITDVAWVPQRVIEILCLEYKKNTFHMLQLSGEMESLCRTLNEEQIPSIFLKGPVLASDLYGDISLRTSCDLDILIPIHDLERAEKLLIELGYVKNEYIQTVLGDWKWRHHHFTYYHAKKRIKLEIHWRLNPGPSKEPGFRKLWERRRASPLTSYPVYLLGREDLFLFLVSHGSRHGWSRLRWLADIDRISRQDMDWIQLKKLLNKYQCLQIGGQALILAEHLLQTPLTELMKSIIVVNRSRRLAKDALFYIQQMINLHTEPLPEDVSNYHKRHLFALMSIQQKILFILSFMYPYHEDTLTLPLPKKLHFLYFPLRPFVWVWRKTKRQALP